MTRNGDDRVRYLPDTGWMGRPQDVQPALQDAVECEVAVVGGGLGGMAAALRLAELGVDVVLLEADLCGWGASSRNAGFVSATLATDRRILSAFYADRLDDLNHFAQGAVTFTESLLDKQSIECHYRRTEIGVAAANRVQLRELRALAGEAGILSPGELGIPRGFLGGMPFGPGGVMNPAEFCVGMRSAVLSSPVRVFEQSPVVGIAEDGSMVELTTSGGAVWANRVLLATSAFLGTHSVTPPRLGSAVRITAVETEPIDEEHLDRIGWTSRMPLVTAHIMKEAYRLTDRGTVVMTTRQLQVAERPLREREPDAAVVRDLVRGFHQRFVGLENVRPAQAWSGLVAMTPSQLPMAGKVSPRIWYSSACNGKGLTQAPYLGHLLAEHIHGADMNRDLRAVWREKSRFAPGVVHPLTLKLGWIFERTVDLLK